MTAEVVRVQVPLPPFLSSEDRYLLIGAPVLKEQMFREQCQDLIPTGHLFRLPLRSIQFSPFLRLATRLKPLLYSPASYVLFNTFESALIRKAGGEGDPVSIGRGYRLNPSNLTNSIVWASSGTVNFMY